MPPLQFAEYRSKKQFLRLQFGQGLPGAVAKAGAPIRVAVGAPSSADPGIDAISGIVTRSAMGVPISSYCTSIGARPQLLGVIIVGAG